MSRTVLVVDDLESIRMLVTMSLQKDDFEVLEAADGVEGLAQMDGRSIDLVIVDIAMPRMNGYRMIQELRQRPQYRTTPVLVLTGVLEQEDKQRGREVGATGWIVKPFKPQKLLETVRRVMVRGNVLSHPIQDGVQGAQQRSGGVRLGQADAEARLTR